MLGFQTVVGECRGEVFSRAEVSLTLRGEPPFYVLLVGEIMPGRFAVLLRSRSVYLPPTIIYTVQLVLVATSVKLLLFSLIHSLSALCTYTHSLTLACPLTPYAHLTHCLSYTTHATCHLLL